LEGNSCDVVHALVAIIDTKAHQTHECEAAYGESYDEDYDASFENELGHDDYPFWICFAVGSALTNEGGDQREVSDILVSLVGFTRSPTNDRGVFKALKKFLQKVLLFGGEV
jgi:hypothetical protein